MAQCTAVYHKFREASYVPLIWRQLAAKGISSVRSLVLALVLMASGLLCGCNPAAEENDPIRSQFVESCDGMRAYISMKPQERTNLCKCVYDQTLSGLEEKEKQYARFYLFEQAGAASQSNRIEGQPDMNAMLKASNAIGEAVKSCG